MKEWLQTLPASDWDEIIMKWTNEATSEFSTSADNSVLRKDSITWSKKMKKVGVRAYVVSHVLYVNPFQTKTILRSSPKEVKSLSSETSPRLKLQKHGAAFPALSISAVAYVWSPKRVWAGWGSDFPNPVQCSSLFHPSIEQKKKKHDCCENFFIRLSVSHTQSTHVAIFVHCILTNHLHDYEHLCRCFFTRYEHVRLFHSLSS